MKFQFRLETVLGHRRSLEELAQKDFLEAQARVRQAVEQLEGLIEQKRLARARILDVQTKGGMISSESQSIAQFISGQDILIQRSKKHIYELEVIADEKRVKLIEATREVKVLERLREKNLVEFKKTQAVKEAKQMDDIAVMRYARSNRE